MTKPSFQDKEVNPFCNNQSGLETFEEFCCPKCTQETKKEICYECPIDYYRFGKKCYGTPDYNIEQLMANHNIEAKVEQLDEINSIKAIDTQHTAEEINDIKTIDTNHKAEKGHCKEEVIEHNKTSTQHKDGDDVNCPSNIPFAEQVGELNSIVSSEPNKVEENKQHVPGNEHKVHTGIKTTLLSKSNAMKNETIDKTKDNRNTINIQSKTENSTPKAIDPGEMKIITKIKKQQIDCYMTQKEIKKRNQCQQIKDVPICDQTSNELYENYILDKTELNNFTVNKLEEQTDPNHFVSRNKSLLRIADRGSKTSTNSNKSTISSNSKSAESDVSSVSFKTAPSESPRLSEVDDIQQYFLNEDTVKDRSSSSDTEGQTVYENIPYLSGMETTLKTDSESDTTAINELDNGATTDTKNHPVEVLTPISEKIEDSQLVTTRDNRVSSGSDESFHSVQNQCLDLDSHDKMVKSNVRYNAINSTKSFDMSKITSQTNMSFTNSPVTLVINQSN
ncbi:unnamed protein product [Mytilus edulis]|uniref:Uncharacterized protein n=1 Tax=Mytilus edulis TaxID=6550 RepID=A0A8S3U950_MYTED|nr:unnamed protein product [Mytilus edulis]